jgi:4-amino-4-deoxy-L-arabinose transferase-like glycosyltransferase
VTRRAATLLLLALALVALGLRFYELGTPDLVGGDEGYYGTYARNILEGGRQQLLNLGREPLSAPDNKPFLFPLLLAGAVAVGGATETSLRLVAALAGLATAVLVGGLVRRQRGALAGWAAGAAVLLLPPLVYASRSVMGEGVLAAFGVAGAWAAVTAIEEEKPGRALLAGALWGCGFLVKLWLVGLFILPVLAALVADRTRRFRLRPWLVFALSGLTFVLVGGLHLGLVALWSPGTLRHWLNEYFVFSLFGRAGGQDFADYWHQPYSYYLRTTLQTCFMALPLALLALAGGRTAEEERSAGLPARVLWGAMALELFLVSFMAVKLRQYTFPLLPALAALSGIGFADLVEGRARAGRFAAAASAALLVPLGIWQFGPQPLFPSLAFAAPAAAFVAGSAAVLWLASKRPTVAAGLLGAAALLAGAGGAAVTVKRECLAHRTGYREAARVLVPALAGIAPEATCFLSPEVPSMQFYLFRTGRYWASPYEPRPDEALLSMARDPAIRAFVTTARKDLYGGPTPPAVERWLEENTTEVTARVSADARCILPIRVFVKGPEH